MTHIRYHPSYQLKATSCCELALSVAQTLLQKTKKQKIDSSALNMIGWTFIQSIIETFFNFFLESTSQSHLQMFLFWLPPIYIIWINALQGTKVNGLLSQKWPN